MSVSAKKGGADSAFVHDQPISLTPWTINHNLGKYPDVTVVDSGLVEVEADVQYTSLNQVVISFTIPMAGKAFLN